jgi:hypothetical protein
MIYNSYLILSPIVHNIIKRYNCITYTIMSDVEYSDDEYIDTCNVTSSHHHIKDLDIEINEHIYQIQPHVNYVNIQNIGTSNKNTNAMQPITKLNNKYFEYIVRSIVYTKDRYIRCINNNRLDIMKIDVRKKDNNRNIGSVITTFIPNNTYNGNGTIDGHYQQIFDDGNVVYIIQKNYKYIGNDNIIPSMMEFACSTMMELIS